MKYLIIILNRIRKKRIILTPNVMPVVRTLEEDFLDSPEKFGALINFYGVLLRKLKEEATGIEIVHHITTLDPDLYKMMRVEESPKISPSMAKYIIETLKRRALKAGTKPLNIFANEKKTRYKTRYKEIIEFLERLYKYAIKTRRECRAEFFRSKIRSLKRLKEPKKIKEGRKEEEEKVEYGKKIYHISEMDWEFPKDSKSEIVRFLDNVGSIEDVEVLLIEDDLSTIRLVESYFKSKGHNCKGVVYGASGLYLLRNFLRPKVVLTNIISPDMTGYEVCKSIKSDPDLKSIPVIFFTAQSALWVVKKLEETKADGYILKPFAFSDFDRIFDLLNTQKNKDESTKNSERRSLTDEEIEEKKTQLIKLYEEERREEKEVELENLKEVKKKRARENKITESERVWKVLHPRIPPPYSSEIKKSKSINTFWTRCNVCFKKIPRGKTCLTKTTCPSCASSLESGFWKGITLGLPLEEHGIERWHLNEIWEYPEIVSELVKILGMDIQDLQENKLSVTLTVLELIDQIEDKEIRKSANCLLQLFIDIRTRYGN